MADGTRETNGSRAESEARGLHGAGGGEKAPYVVGDASCRGSRRGAETRVESDEKTWREKGASHDSNQADSDFSFWIPTAES